MISQPSHTPSFLKRVIRRLGLDSKQDSYFFYMPNTKSPKGSFIALAAVFMVIVAVLVPVAMTLVQNIRRNTLQAQEYVAGAQNAAKAGLEDTLGYFVRQNKLLTAYPSQIMEATPTVFTAGISYVDQPFNPFYNTSNASYSDTFQGTTINLAGGITHAFYGLCNEYPLDAATNTLAASGTQVSSVFFARYEVQEQTNPVVTPAPTLNPLAVHDISGERETNYMNGDGLTWAINSTGYIYERKDYTVDNYGEYRVPYNVFPNKVLATAKAYTEFRKLSCTLPNSNSGVSYAAVYASAATDVILTGSCRLGNTVANGYGLCAMAGSASATAPTGAAATNFFGGGMVVYPGASGSAGSTANGPISDVNVFGMSLKDIQFIADYEGNQASGIPMTIQEPYKLSYYNGNLTYGPTQAATIYQRLYTSGILCVNGSLTLQSGGFNSAGTSDISGSDFTGIIFATGNVTIQPGCGVDGLIVLGYSAANPGQPPPQLSLPGGSTGSYSVLYTDPEAVIHVIQQVAQYREDISARKVLLAFPGI
jgi:hypothetical protein